MTNSYETVNDVLVKLFKEIMGIEEKALITSEYKDISALVEQAALQVVGFCACIRGAGG